MKGFHQDSVNGFPGVLGGCDSERTGTCLLRLRK